MSQVDVVKQRIEQQNAELTRARTFLGSIDPSTVLLIAREALARIEAAGAPTTQAPRPLPPYAIRV